MEAGKKSFLGHIKYLSHSLQNSLNQSNLREAFSEAFDTPSTPRFRRRKIHKLVAKVSIYRMCEKHGTMVVRGEVAIFDYGLCNVHGMG